MDHTKHHQHADGSDCHCDHDHAAAGSESAIDPICGMTVQKASARHTSQHQGETYYFCSDGCRMTFDKNPALALAQAGPRR